MFFRLAVFILTLTPAFAEAPRVSADILPVHSLVARVMEGIGKPDLILPPGASPHSYAMRPSEASALEQAAVIFWVGDSLTPWLSGPIATLAPQATTVALLDHPDTIRHLATEDAGHDHDHGPIDPHAWLDPENGVIWLGIIADALAAQDPGNENLYRANAKAAKADLTALSMAMQAELAPLAQIKYAVYHDAYRYFEERFGLSHSFAILSSEAEKPSPRRIAQLRKMAQLDGVTRIYSEPQVATDLIPTVFEGVDTKHCILDPVGSEIAPGAMQYWQLLQKLVRDMAVCTPPDAP